MTVSCTMASSIIGAYILYWLNGLDRYQDLRAYCKAPERQYEIYF